MGDDEPQSEPKNGGRMPPISGRFKKGQSGNPSGKPKGTINLSARIRRELEALAPDKKQQFADLVAKKIVAEMLKGKVDLIRDFMDREEGKPKTPIEHSGTLNIAEIIASEKVIEPIDGDQPDE